MRIAQPAQHNLLDTVLIGGKGGKRLFKQAAIQLGGCSQLLQTGRILGQALQPGL